MTSWGASRWEALGASRGQLLVAAFLFAAVSNFATMDLDGLMGGAIWVVAAIYYAEWQFWHYRYRQHEHYITRGQEIEHKIEVARRRGHGNILISFDQNRRPS